MKQQNKMKNTNKENKTVLCPDKSKREFCEGKNDCWETNYCECPEAQKLCKNNMAEKIMKDFNINDNEEKDRILNIFHGNSSVLYNLSNTEKQVETNTPTQAKKQVDESTQESPPVTQPKKQTQAEVAAEKIQEQEQAQAEIAAQIQEQEQAQAQMAAQIQEQEQMQAQAVAQTNMTGGMNMLEETMEILNKFHGGSINYQKF